MFGYLGTNYYAISHARNVLQTKSLQGRRTYNWWGHFFRWTSHVMAANAPSGVCVSVVSLYLARAGEIVLTIHNYFRAAASKGSTWQGPCELVFKL